MDKPKTIVFLVTIEDSALLFYKGFVRYLTDRGWRVFIGANSPTGRLKQWAQSEGGRAIHIDWKRDPSPASDLVILIRTWRLLCKIRPDIVVASTAKASLVGTLAAFLARVPVRIYSLWGLRLETTSGIFRKVLIAMERLTFACSTQCVAITQSLADRATELGLSGGKTIKVLGSGSDHGVNIDYFKPGLTLSMSQSAEEFLAQYHADFTVVFVGRLHPDKGIDTLVKAVRICLDHGLRVQTLIVGAAEGAEVEMYLHDMPVGLVHLVGQVDDVRPYLLAADVLCLPSLREGFGNVVLEAAASSIPAVVTDATGVRDSIVDGETGKMIPVGDAQALAQVFMDLNDDPETKRRLGAAARLRAEREFNQPLVWGLQVANFEDQLGTINL